MSDSISFCRLAQRLYTVSMARLMGIDYGLKRVGVALTDEEARVAFPKAVVPNDRHLVSVIIEMIAGSQVSEVVIGESKDNRGADNSIARSARTFALRLEAETGVIIHFEPEQYSSQEARTHTGNYLVDAEAAAIILNSFLSKRYDDQH